VNVQEQLAKLESLLDRIRRNAASPRPVATTHAVAAPDRAPIPSADDAVPLSASPPTARADYPPAGVPDVAPEPQAELEELDMMDAEIVEIEGAGVAASADDIDLGPGLDEPVPESAPRAAQALADEADLEPPVKTPPPESGRQIVAPPVPVSFKEDEAEEAELGGVADVDALLEPDHSGGPFSKAPPGMPTMEQLGETVELEGADHPPAILELAAPAEEKRAAPDELELSLPQASFSGGYARDLAPPGGASEDLERLRRADAERAAQPEPVSLAMSAPPLSAAMSERPLGAAMSAAPAVIERPPVDAPHAAEIVSAAPRKLPASFIELLDLSLRL
jgi:hypothetical protein